MALKIIAQNFNLVEIEGFLARILGGLDVHSGTRINEQEQYKFKLDEDFSADTDGFYKVFSYRITPLETANSGETALSGVSGSFYALTLPNVLQLLVSTINTLRDHDFQNKNLKEFSDSDIQVFSKTLYDILFTPVQALSAQLQSSPGQVEDGRVEDHQQKLIQIAKDIQKAILDLRHPPAQVKPPKTLLYSLTLPDWLLRAKQTPLLQKEHWELVRKVISELPIDDQKGFLDKAFRDPKLLNIGVQEQEDFPGIKLDTTERFSLVTLRKFLNEWADLIIKENLALPKPQQVFVESEIAHVIYFPDKTKSSIISEFEIIEKPLDFDALRYFKESLIKRLVEYKPGKAANGAISISESAEDGAGNDTEQPNDKKIKIPKDEAEQKALKDELLDFHSSIQEEAARVREISTGFFLAFNHLPPEGDWPISLRNDPAFQYFQRELNSEIVALLERNPQALDELKSGDRSKFIHSFLFRLISNPKFQFYLTKLKEDYVKEVAVQSGLSADEVEAELAKNPKLNQSPDEIIEQITKEIVRHKAEQAASEAGPKQFINAQSLTKEHFAEVLSSYDALKDPSDQQEIFEAADLLMLMRVSPERIAQFSKAQLESILGVPLGKLNEKDVKELASLLSLYIGLRRGWFENQYGAHSISQDQDKDYLPGDLSADEMERYQQKKEFIRQSGLGDENGIGATKHFLRAAVLTPSQIQDLAENGDPAAAQTQAAAELFNQERKAAYAKFAYEMAIQDANYSALLQEETGLRFKEEMSEAAYQANALRLQAMVEANSNYSQFEQESGVVTDSDGNIIRSEADADQSRRAGKRQGLANTTFSAVTKKAKSEALAALGGLVTGAIIPGGALLPKVVNKQVGKAVIGAGVLIGGAGLAEWGSLMGQYGTVLGTGFMGAALGAGAGAAAGFAAAAAGGPVAMFFGGLFGGLAGGAGGFVGGLGIGGALSNGGLSLNLGGAKLASAATPAAANGANLAGGAKTLIPKIGNFAKAAVSSPAGVGVTGFVGTVGIGTILTYTQYAAAFLPPDIAYAPGEQNKYITLTKTADPTTAADPTTVNYAIKIAAKPTYTVTITDVTDTIIVATKDPNQKPATPAPIDLGKYKVALNPQTLPSEDINYSIPFDATYKDSLVTNSFKVSFTVTDGPNLITDTAMSQAAVCFGDCPKPKAGCWPTTGRITQLPFGSFDHGANGEDAYDIGAVIGTPIYAPVSGNVCASNGGGSYHKADPTIPGDKDKFVLGYGNELSLRADAAGGNYNYTFGHLNSYAPGLSFGVCKNVQAGDLIGYVGSTGASNGSHLHYQVGPERQHGVPSLLNTLVPPKPPGNTIPELFDDIKTCYGPQ